MRVVHEIKRATNEKHGPRAEGRSLDEGIHLGRGAHGGRAEVEAPGRRGARRDEPAHAAVHEPHLPRAVVGLDELGVVGDIRAVGEEVGVGRGQGQEVPKRRESPGVVRGGAVDLAPHAGLCGGRALERARAVAERRIALAAGVDPVGVDVAGIAVVQSERRGGEEAVLARADGRAEIVAVDVRADGDGRRARSARRTSIIDVDVDGLVRDVGILGPAGDGVAPGVIDVTRRLDGERRPRDEER
ncbi:hypothetical protein E8A74_19690 [Polyangium fumosum]|uniref:Uncharacterized protein n=1 Tax=Polyangium fumosum TaxID=889272 RepID=A0A4U1JBB9_9BACT|nr:hypothetical protein E8A74_19690 [Polyangium fumosum]